VRATYLIRVVPDGWYPKQAFTVAETVYAYTAGAAYDSGEEAIRGTLLPGILADLAEFSGHLYD